MDSVEGEGVTARERPSGGHMDSVQGATVVSVQGATARERPSGGHGGGKPLTKAFTASVQIARVLADAKYGNAPSPPAVAAAKAALDNLSSPAPRIASQEVDEEPIPLFSGAHARAYEKAAAGARQLDKREQQTLQLHARHVAARQEEVWKRHVSAGNVPKLFGQPAAHRALTVLWFEEDGGAATWTPMEDFFHRPDSDSYFFFSFWILMLYPVNQIMSLAHGAAGPNAVLCPTMIAYQQRLERVVWRCSALARPGTKFAIFVADLYPRFAHPRKLMDAGATAAAIAMLPDFVHNSFNDLHALFSSCFDEGVVSIFACTRTGSRKLYELKSAAEAVAAAGGVDDSSATARLMKASLS